MIPPDLGSTALIQKVTPRLGGTAPGSGGRYRVIPSNWGASNFFSAILGQKKKNITEKKTQNQKKHKNRNNQSLNSKGPRIGGQIYDDVPRFWGYLCFFF